MVVAHPDDEALWLSSAVSSVGRIVFGFGDVLHKPGRSQARRQAVAGLRLDGIINLQIPESGVDWKAYLARPELGPSGVRICEADVRARYEANFARLLEGLRAALGGCSDVYTHNPWGEYGHPEHIQVYRAVATLQDEFGYTVWFSNYVGRDNWSFVKRQASHLHWTRRAVVRPDVATARALRQVYRRNGAWTWTPAHRWPEREVLYAQSPSTSTVQQHRFSGEWLLDVQALRWWPPSWRGGWRLLDPVKERRAYALPR